MENKPTKILSHAILRFDVQNFPGGKPLDPENMHNSDDECTLVL